jgi:hypothetical protein
MNLALLIDITFDCFIVKEMSHFQFASLDNKHIEQNAYDRKYSINNYTYIMWETYESLDCIQCLYILRIWMKCFLILLGS